MRIDIITLFPDIFFGPFAESIVGRAREQRLLSINCVNLRDYTHDVRKTVDDKPYGGGPGMLLKPEPIIEAVRDLRSDETVVVLTSPQGELFTQKVAQELSEKKHIVFVCGHYEGVDERVRQTVIDREYSIGDYILTSGNLAAMVMTDSVVRLVPGVLGSAESHVEESHSNGLLEYPQYTRPAEFEGLCVPDVLTSGNHKAIEKWRNEMSLKRTKERRPDMIESFNGKI